MKQGMSVEESLKLVADPQKEYVYTAMKIVLMPPRIGSAPNVRLREEFLPYLRSDNIGGAEPWITPFLGRIEKLCERKGPSPYFTKTYN